MEVWRACKWRCGELVSGGVEAFSVTGAVDNCRGVLANIPSAVGGEARPLSGVPYGCRVECRVVSVWVP